MSLTVALGLLAAAVGILLVLVLVLRVHGFLALLAVSLFVALAGGLEPLEIASHMQKAMGATLGYIAVVIGLGAIFGELLEKSGGASVIARRLLDRFGEDRAPTALGLTGLVVAIPVFFDVAFILFVPLLWTLARRTGRPLIGFAIPLLAGLAVAHAFIPPTPGPVAVAGLLGADLGWVILFGLCAAVPALLIGGVWFGGRLASGPLGELPLPEMAASSGEEPDESKAPSFGLAIGLVALPLVLILSATWSKVQWEEGSLRTALQVIGHPFVALLLTVGAASVALSRRCGWSAREIEKMAGRSLEPVGAILLLTGAGGVLGKTLLATGAGGVLAGALEESGLPLLFLGFLIAWSLRLAQGSATVAMVTTAGLLAPLLEADPVGGRAVAALVVAIAAGATATSHVNDSGFWLVSKYLGLSEKQTLRSWTAMTSWVGGVGFLAVLLVSSLIGCAPAQQSEAPSESSQSETPSETVEDEPPATPPLASVNGARAVGSIQSMDDDFLKLVPADAEIQVMAEGFQWSEGPVWIPSSAAANEEGFVLFSDVPQNRIHRWSASGGLETWLEPSGYTGDVPRGGEPGSNGLFLDADGHLVLAQHGDRRIARLRNPASRQISDEASFETVADRYDGRRFHSPNDLVIHSSGSVYFTDPPYGLDGGPESSLREMEWHGVYHWDAGSNEVGLVSDTLTRPNGVVLSPDEKTLYVANSDPERAVWVTYDLSSESADGPSEKLFFDATDQVAENPGLPDGMAVAVGGEIFATGPGGVWVFDPDGRHLGTLSLPVPSANCVFGGEDGSELWITADAYLLKVQTSTRGLVGSRP